jgi:hypothetical protein
MAKPQQKACSSSLAPLASFDRWPGQEHCRTIPFADKRTYLPRFEESVCLGLLECTQRFRGLLLPRRHLHAKLLGCHHDWAG